MRFLFLLCVFCAALNGSAQMAKNHSLQVPAANQNLESWFTWLEGETGWKLVYGSHLPLNKSVSLKSQTVAAEEFLNLLLADLPLKATFNLPKVLLVPSHPNLGFVHYAGTVVDGFTGEQLVSAHIRENQFNLGAASNGYGYFHLAVPNYLDHQVEVSFLGYEKRLLTGNQLHSDSLKTVKLYPEPLQLVEVELNQQAGPSTGIAQVPLKVLKKTPTLLGEKDLLRQLQTQPGMVQTGDISSGLIVRGSSPDQNLILLDDVPVYNITHLFGLFSIFHTPNLKSVQVMKSHIPARYNGRVASVLDLRMKEGNTKQWQGEAGVNMVTGYLTLEGPLVKDKWGMLFSARRSLLDLFFSPYTENELGYQFNDVLFKNRFVLSPKENIYLSVYNGQDRMRITTDLFNDETIEYRLGWGNFTSSLRYTNILSAKWFSSLTASFTRYRYFTLEEKALAGTPYNTEEISSALQDMRLHWDVQHQLGVNWFMEMGTSLTLRQFNPSRFEVTTQSGTALSEVVNASHTTEVPAYVQFAYTPDVRNHLEFGANLQYFHSEGYDFFRVLPRAYYRRDFYNRQLFADISAGMLSQHLHLLTNPGLSLPTDMWVPAIALAPPPVSNQLSVGLGGYIGTPSFSWKVEGFIRNQNQLITLLGQLEPGSWENQIEKGGTARAHGVEMGMQKITGSTTGSIAYTWVQSTWQFERLNKGKAFPSNFDRPHNFNLTLEQNIGKGWSAQMGFTYATGRALTVPTGFTFRPDGTFVAIYDAYNNARLPDFHRLDFGVNWDIQRKKWGHTFGIGVYNLYGRKNAILGGMEVSYENEQPEVRYYYNYLFGSMPYFSYTLSWGNSN